MIVQKMGAIGFIVAVWLLRVDAGLGRLSRDLVSRHDARDAGFSPGEDADHGLAAFGHPGSDQLHRVDSGKPPALPHVGAACTHWHEWVNACLQGGPTTSSFAWAGRLSEMVLLGNAAMDKPGVKLRWDAAKATFI